MQRYSDIEIIKSPKGKRMYSNVKYPFIPRSLTDIYIYVKEGMRYDTLAQQYYGDSNLWWIIAVANEQTLQNSLYPVLGSQLRIPLNPNPTIDEYERINPTI